MRGGPGRHGLEPELLPIKRVDEVVDHHPARRQLGRRARLRS